MPVSRCTLLYHLVDLDGVDLLERLSFSPFLLANLLALLHVHFAMHGKYVIFYLLLVFLSLFGHGLGFSTNCMLGNFTSKVQPHSSHDFTAGVGVSCLFY